MIAALDDDAHVARAARALRRAAGAALRTRARGRGLPDRPLRGLALPLGHPRRGLLGRPSPGSPSAASWSRPATFYGAAGREHVRVAFTATDERVDAAVRPPRRLDDARPSVDDVGSSVSRRRRRGRGRGARGSAGRRREDDGTR